MFWLVRDARAQNPDSHYVNKARNPDWNPELGEFAKNVGGQIPFVNTDAGVKPIFFDYAALDAYLPAPGIQIDAQHWLDAASRWQGTTCAWYLGMQPGASCSNVCSTSNSLGSYNWERWTINGAAVTIKWDPTANPGVRHVFFSGPGGHSNAWRDWSTSTQPEPDCILQDPIKDYPGKPIGFQEAVILRGHILVGLSPTRGHSVWSMLQRMNDILWFLKNDHPLAWSGRAYVGGFSWGAVLANTATFFDPESFYGAFGGGMLPDFGYEVPQGGWRKINGHRDAAFGCTIWMTPPRSQGYQNWFAVEEMGIPTDFFSENLSTAEMTGFSLMRRLNNSITDKLRRNVLGVSANVDRHFNLHWYKETFEGNDLTDDWVYYQMSGHGEPDSVAGTNEFHFEDGPAVVDQLLTYTAAATNPPIAPDPPITTDQYPNPYLHTLSANVSWNDFGPQSVPFLVERSFQVPHFGAVQRIGQGVFPGAVDSIKVGDFDGDGKTEVIFGNYDGFVHVMELSMENLGGVSVPLLRDEWRSPQLGWGVSALDIGTLGVGKWIVAADSGGKIWKMRIYGDANYGQPASFTTSPETGKGPLQYLHVGNFSPAAGGNEVLVQDEFSRFLLFSSGGGFLSKTERRQDNVDTANKYTGMTGKPSKAVDLSTPNGQEVIVPCMDGFLRRLSYGAGNVPVVHAFPFGLEATQSVCLPFAPNGQKFKVIVGAAGNVPPPGTHPANFFELPFLALFEVDGNQITLLSVYNDPDPNLNPRLADPIVALEWTDATNQIFAVGSGRKLSLFQIVSDQFVGLTVAGGLGSITVPGVPDPPGASAAPTGFPIGETAICGVEVFGDYVYVPVPSGRIFLYDKATLAPARQSDHVDWPFTDPAKDQPLPWPSNHTLGWTFGVEENTDRSRLYFLDGKVPYANHRNVTTDPFVSYDRIGTIDPTNNDPTVMSVDEIYNSTIIQHKGETGWNDLDIKFNEALEPVRIEPSFEVGDLYVNGPSGRSVMYRNFDPLIGNPGGGYVFYFDPAADPASGALHNFDVDILTSLGYSRIEPGANKLRGQYTTQQGTNLGLYFGNSMKLGQLPVPNGNPRDLIVVGTLGGMVYVIDPEVADDDSGNAALVYQLRTDLGWGVMGLDIGDVDGWLTGGDPTAEIVVGTWLDDGTYQDYQNGNPVKHRGHIYVLDPDPATGSLIVKETITLNDNYLPALFSSGLLGLRIDNVDGDRDATTNLPMNEIWCGDATGYLYCLGRDPNDHIYKAFYRSKGIGCYPGIYNNLHPHKKSVQNKPEMITDYLVVFTPGYVYRFEVQGAVPW